MLEQTGNQIIPTARRRVMWRNLASGLGLRLAQGVITLIVILFLTFFGLDMARGVAFRSAVVQGILKTIRYLGNALQGDLGQTVEYGYSRLPKPVVNVLPEILIRSFGLLLAALGIAVIGGIVLGIWSARRRHNQSSLLTLILAILGISVPSFFLALLLQMAVIRLTWFTGRSYLPVGGFGWDTHLVLPALVLAARPLAQIARVTHVTLSEALEQDYVRTAQSKGLRPEYVLNVHVLKNVAVPVLTTIGVSLRFSLSSLPVVEFFFGWQGLGYHLLKAIASQDDNLAAGMLVSLGAFFILVNLILTVAYVFIDPRLRPSSEKRVISQLDWRAWRARMRKIPGQIAAGFARLLSGQTLRRWLSGGAGEELPRLTDADTGEQRAREASEARAGRAGVLAAWRKGTLGNPALILSSLMVAGLLVVIVFGAEIAPHSPYTTQGLVIENGEFSTPPFPPGGKYPWGSDVLGRDLMSLILAGAQQTFLLASLVLLARLAVGFGLGALSGWWSGSWLDRFLLSTVEVIAAFPTLLLAMTLILALDIRTGMVPFVIALCFVGWGEIMQFVRGEVMRIRTRMFIDSAVASGMTSIGIMARHILPNLLPALISIAALEMGAVLMLLGELGFIGIFIGGGIFAELEWQSPLYHYSDVPEWGALLSNVRTYARAYSWMAIYPSLAIFVAILTMNLFGEGLRRFIDVVGFRLSRIFNRYTFAAGMVLVGGFVTWRGSTGSTAVYARQARQFDGMGALERAAVLAAPAFEGRGLGSLGMRGAAEYIAGEFQALDIQPAGQKLTYFFERERDYLVLKEPPTLELLDGGSSPVYGRDFNLYPARTRSAGTAEGPIHYVALKNVTSYTQFGYIYYPGVDKLDFEGQILLVEAEDMPWMEQVPHAGALVITENPNVMGQRYTLSPYNRHGQRIGAPAFWITQEIAKRLIEAGGHSLTDFHRAEEALLDDEALNVPLGVDASLDVHVEEVLRQPVQQVIGHLPGYASSEYGGTDNQLIVVMAQYDRPPVGPEGIYPSANDNASGVALMLEVIENMRNTGYQPYKTFLFVAYSGEGTEGGGQVQADVQEYLSAKHGFSSEYKLEAVIELQGVGAGEEPTLVLTSDGSRRLARLFEDSARRMGVDTRLTGADVELNRLFVDGSTREKGVEAPTIRLSWQGWEARSGTAQDDLQHLSANWLERAGRTTSLALMVLGRETDY